MVAKNGVNDPVDDDSLKGCVNNRTSFCQII